MNNNSKLLNIFADNIVNDVVDDPVAWVKENVISLESARSTHVDLNLSPFLLPIFNEVVKEKSVKQINLLAPVGSGKSTLFVALINYWLVNDPANILLALNNQAELNNFIESRLYPTFEKNEKLQALMPKKHTAQRKTEIIFPHCNFWGVPLVKSRLQSKSCRFVIADEVWLAQENGVLSEIKRRTHDRYNSLVLFCAQGGFGGSEWHKEYDSGEIFNYSWKCPHCGGYNNYDWRDVKYQHEENIDWERFSESVHMECPLCNHIIDDTITNRRHLADNRKYVSQGNNGLPGVKSYNFNALAQYWIPWGELAIEWVKANEAKKQGDKKLLEQFLQKRLAQNLINEFEKESFIKLHLVADTFEDLNNKEYFNKILAVDVQKDHYWHVIYGFDKDKNMYLLNEGKLNYFEEIKDVIRKFDIKPECVCFDTGYDSTRIKKLCGENKFFGLNGTNASDYPRKIKGIEYKFVYSELEKNNFEGIVSNNLKYSSQESKNLIHQKVIQNKLIIPLDVSQTFIKHFAAESLQEVIDKKTGRKTKKWQQTSSHAQNHMFDCTCQANILFMALNQKLFFKSK